MNITQAIANYLYALAVCGATDKSDSHHDGRMVLYCLANGMDELAWEYQYSSFVQHLN